MSSTPGFADDATVDVDPGLVSTFAGGGSGDGVGTAAGFTSVGAEVVVGGTLVVADNDQLRTVDLSSGSVATLAGQAGDSNCTVSPTESSVSVGDLAGLATDGTWLYEFSDCGGSPEVLRTSLSTGATSLVANVSCQQHFLPVGSAQGLAYGPDGNLYAACNGYGPLVQVQPDTGTTTNISAYLHIGSIAADSSGLWVTESYFGSAGVYQITLGATPTPGPLAAAPAGITPDKALVSAGDYLYAGVTTKTYNSGSELERITKSDGTMTAVAGNQSAGLYDGNGPNAWFGSIQGLASDGTSLWVADGGSSQAIRQVVPGPALPPPTAHPITTDDATVDVDPGLVSTFAGGGSGDGVGTAAGFTSVGAEVVVGGTLVVADNDQLRTVDLSSGSVATLAGQAGDSGCTVSPTESSVSVGDLAGLATDGTWLYEFSDCGGSPEVLRTSLSTGATSLVANVSCQQHSLPAGSAQGLAYGPDGNLYAACNGYGPLVQVQPDNGTTTNISGYLHIGSIVADSSGLWVTGSYPGSAGVYQITLGATPTVGPILEPPAGITLGSALVSAGDYLYSSGLASFTLPDGSVESFQAIVQITKSSGAMTVVAGGGGDGLIDGTGGGASFSSIAGLGSDGTNLWVSDGGANQVVRKVGLGETLASVTGAGGPTSPGETSGGSNPSEPGKCQPCSGDPVDAATGEFVAAGTDVSVPGRGMALDLERTYGSLSSTVLGSFGYGWSDSYDMSIGPDPYLGSSVMDIHQENGSVTQFELQADGSWVAASRVEATLVENGDGSWTFTRHATAVYSFDPSGQLVSESDLNGETTTLSYNPSGRLTSVTDPGGRELSFAYGSNGLVSSVTDPAGQVVRYGYNSDDELTSVTDLDGNVTAYTYDTNRLLTSITDPDNNTTTNAYDTSRRVISQTDRAGRTTTWAYAIDPSTTSGTTTITDPSGRVTVDTFTDGELTSSTAAADTSDAATTSYSYSPVTDQQTSVTDPDGNVTDYTYDTDGNMLTQTDPLGRVTTWTYNDLDEVTTETPPATYGGNTATTTYTYDEPAYSSGGSGNLTTTSTPILSASGASEGTQTTHYIHGDSAHPGDVTSMVDPDGHTWTYTYDADGDKTSQTAPATTDTAGTDASYAPVTRWAYNLNTGRVTAQLAPRYTQANPDDTNCTTPAPGCTTTTYNYLGQTLTVTDGDGNTTTNVYDPDGDLTSTTDGDGHRTTYGYNADNEPTSTTTAGGTSEAQTSTVAFTADGQTAAQTDAAGDETTYTYNPLNEQSSITDPDGRTTTYTYDADGDLTVKANPGHTCNISSTAVGCTIYSYDADNELTAVDYNDVATTPNITDITYNGNGDKTTETSTDPTGTGTVTERWVTDSVGNLTSSTDTNGATVGYHYDDNSNQTSMTYPGSTGTVTYGYDPDGRMNSVTDWDGNQTTYTYTPDSAIAAQTAPTTTTPVVDTTTYDNADNPTTISVDQGATNLASFTDTYDNDNQIDTTASTGIGADATNDNYNAKNQLSGVTDTTTATPTSYNYDNADNPTHLAGGVTQNFDNANQLCWTTTVATTYAACNVAPAGATTYSYNERGDLTNISPPSGSAITLDYDQADRLISYGTTNSYTYNPDGLRATETVGTTTHTFAYDQAAPTALIVTDGTNDYIYGPDSQPIEQTDSTTGNNYWLHQDQQGNIRLITDDTGTTAGTATYTPYGANTTTTGITTPLGYGNGYTDTSTGLIYLINRYYNPTTAQFLTVDPDYDVTGSRYGYTGNNPINDVDPSGLFCIGSLCTGFHPLRGLEGAANFAAGLANFVVSTATLGYLSVSAPFCGYGLGTSYDIGGWTGTIEADLVGGAEFGGAETESSTVSDLAGAACGGQSFTPSTEVRLADGTSIPLDRVKVGDKVLATDPQTGKTQAEPVTAVWVNHDTDLLDLTVHTASGDTIVDTTQHHLFYDLTTHNWVEAQNLHPGDRLYTADAQLASVVGNIVVPGAADMWDLTVNNDHDFYIDTLTSAVLVHNCGANVPPDSGLGRILARNARTTTDEQELFTRLYNNYGVSPEQASEELHAIKDGGEGNPDVIFTYSGGVYDATSGDYLGSLVP